MEDIESLIKSLRKESDEYRKLEKSHKEYEEKLQELDKVKYPSAEETVEINRIKKLKLQGKDRMKAILNEFKKKLESARV